ncbi:hypothetical protein PM082_004785 [Marasmius tenuissimus]|nr:hypothetical protein PM082_004785 [Marasmius tenuissimus]
MDNRQSEACVGGLWSSRGLVVELVIGHALSLSELSGTPPATWPAIDCALLSLSYILEFQEIRTRSILNDDVKFGCRDFTELTLNRVLVALAVFDCTLPAAGDQQSHKATSICVFNAIQGSSSKGSPLGRWRSKPRTLGPTRTRAPTAARPLSMYTRLTGTHKSADILFERGR